MKLKIAFIIFISSLSLCGNAQEFPIGDCPNKPRCVSTRSSHPDRKISPIPFAGSKTDFLSFATKAIESMPRTKIIKTHENYLHAEIRSAIFRFVDDFEIFYDEDAKIIEIRSAAQAGYYDFDVNLGHTQQFEKIFLAKVKPKF